MKSQPGVGVGVGDGVGVGVGVLVGGGVGVKVGVAVGVAVGVGDGVGVGVGVGIPIMQILNGGLSIQTPLKRICIFLVNGDGAVNVYPVLAVKPVIPSPLGTSTINGVVDITLALQFCP